MKTPRSWLSLPVLVLPTLFGTFSSEASAQAGPARISEEIRTLATYPFSEPNPIPILGRDPRLYPYHSFEGYSATSEPREWTVVKLENDYIEVFVLPEVGGKVWGAIVKETGHEFIYRNEVLKFRNISLRGPWTSGGIEFNFGVIGHAPATATPVDYLLKENPNGSVSCWVGSMDLPSRTHWRVEIRLPANKAYFETNVLWNNPTPLEQPYYNWMTAAAFAQDDLEMSMPGNAYLQHSGNVLDWPVDDEDRYLPLYGNNTFEGHKSYHVVGELNDFFGGYYHDEGYGFGHWSRYEDMPGQKLWLWALSREGGVWEELLTDTDGQYVEFQAGRLFVQYSPGSAVNPITQAGFDPLSSSRWTESWFPLEGTGGLTDASREGALFVEEDGGELTIRVNAFGEVLDTLRVWMENGGEEAGPEASGPPELLTAIPVSLEPLELFETTLAIPIGASFRVQLPGLELDYRSDPSHRRLSRPFATNPEAWDAIPEVDRTVFQARELLKGRQHAEARELFDAALVEEPWNRGALLGAAGLAYRSGLYNQGLDQVNQVLQLDAYDAEANFLAGSLYRALGQTADAQDAFGWAARSTGYRSAAYAQLGELKLMEAAWSEAAGYARLAIDFDRHHVPAWQALAIIGRKTGDGALIDEARRELLALDPLHHSVGAEEYLTHGDPSSAREYLSSLGGEYPGQTLLELAIGYANLGMTGEAITLLGAGARLGVEGAPVLRAWMAWLDQDPARLIGVGDPAFAFPFRPESLPVMAWAAENSDDWIWKYLLALNLWGVDRGEEGAALFEELGQTPDYGPFYAARAQLLSQLRSADPSADLQRAVALAPESRILHLQLIQHYQDVEQWDQVLATLAPARRRFPTDFNLDLLQAKALLNVDRALEATEILERTHVLPSEHARESHRLYEQAHTLAALDAVEAGEFGTAREHLVAALEWPESLGQGKPYEPEERLVRFLLGRVETRLGNESAARKAFQYVVDATGIPPTASDWTGPRTPLDLLGSAALGALGQMAEVEGLNRSWESELATIYRRLENDLNGRMIQRALQLGSEG